MANGGKRKGAGRKAGGKNRLTVIKQTKRAAEVAKLVDSGKPLAIAVLQKAMDFAEGAVAVYRPTMASELASGKTKNEDGSHEEFGKWFDRWYKCIETMARYQTPMMRAVEAPTPPPEPGTNKRRFTLRVFEGGRQIDPNKTDTE